MSMGPRTPMPPTSPSGPNAPPDRDHDWLFVGTVASEQARTEGIAEIKEILADGYQSGSIPQFGFGYEAFLYEPSTGMLEEELDASVAWGYWNRVDFDETAQLYQTTGFRAGYHDGGITVKNAVAVMDHGYFGIGHQLDNSRALEDAPRLTRLSTGGFYGVDNSLNLVGSRDLRSLDLTGSAYTGSAFAIERNSQAGTGHLGTALLILTDKINVGYVGPEYSLTLSINLDNNQHFSMAGTAGGNDDFGRHSRLFVASGGQTGADGLPDYRAAGQFTGQNAEQAFGAFETPDYHGSFGITRQ